MVNGELNEKLHIFRHRENYYLFNPATFASGMISPDAYNFLKNGDNAALVERNSTVMNELLTSGLLSRGDNIPSEKISNLEQWRQVYSSGNDPTVDSMLLMLCQECNLNCIYCYGDGGEYGTGGRMTFETACRAVDWLIGQSGKRRFLYISFYGGEPLMAFDLMRKIVTYTREKCEKQNRELKPLFSVTTNGLLLEDEVIDFIVENDLQVVLSFDGPRDVQDRNRPLKGLTDSSYDKIAPKIRKLLTRHRKVNCRITVIDDTNIHAVIEELDHLGLLSRHLVPASGRVHRQENGVAAGDDAFERLCAYYESEADALILAIKERNLEKLHALTVPGMLMTLLNKVRQQFFWCGVGRTSVAIDVNGEIYPCHRFVGLDDFRCGTVSEPGLQNSPFLEPLIFRNRDCMNCWARDLCCGFCAFSHFAETGSLFETSERFCRSRKKLIELAVYVKSSVDTDSMEWLGKNGSIEEKTCPLDLF